MNWTGAERRLHMRHRARTRVQVTAGDKRRLCRCVNLSASGALIDTGDMQLRKYQDVQLAFLIELGNIVKVHRRGATVVHVTGGKTGVHMGPYVEPQKKTPD